MAAVFDFSESYGAGPTTADTDYVNLLSASIASGSDTTTVPAANPIVIPPSGTAYSYERWIRGHLTGTFTTISDVKFWKYSGTPGTGVTINGGDKGNQTYVTAVNTVSSVATTAHGSWDTEGEAFALGYSTAFSDYVVLQLAIASTAASGNIGTMQYRFGWNEV